MDYKLYDYKFDKSLLENILINRGIKNIDTFLDLDVEDEKALNFTNMQRACAILFEHIKKGNRIFIQPDADVDGTVSSGILIRYLKDRYPNLDVVFALQKENKAHGLTPFIMNQIDELSPHLVILPDSSSNDVEQQNILIEKGIDVIILDHHHIENLDSVNENIILVNNQAPNNVNKFISAAGVVYLFLELYNKIVFKDNFHEKFLDSVALALIADSCDMRDIYTRKLTLQGLDNINNKFIKALIKKQEFKVKKVNIMSIAFYITPLINACIRMSSMEDRIKMFNAFSLEEGIEEAVEICVKAKSKQDRVRDKELKSLTEDITNNNLKDDGAILVVKNDITPAVVGLVANKITDTYKRPAIVLRDVGDKYTGSIRSFTDCFSFKDWLNDSGLVIFCAGHSSAAGIGISKEKLPLLQDKLIELNEIVGQATTMIDKEYKNGKIDVNDVIDIIENDDLWGGKVTEPLFLVTNIHLMDGDINIIGKKQNTVKFRYNNIDYLMFNVSQDEIRNLTKYNSFTLNTIVRFNKNEYNGNVTLQALIEDYEIKECNSFFF